MGELNVIYGPSESDAGKSSWIAIHAYGKSDDNPHFGKYYSETQKIGNFRKNTLLIDSYQVIHKFSRRKMQVDIITDKETTLTIFNSTPDYWKRILGNCSP